ncbi:hypothetical protein CVT24_010415 [Panaeolus cyanescens]|uniref:Uncharacterized protein n=1 Tax=Panaeolus cyanescens TaxID=181874 RepID=A0A409YPM6_9AGAR|nr:hypothetical protein CVT24_010415 [Panaeolus cyanescens]
MAPTTYDLFFTGRDDPRSCVIIGEDVKPVYFCFETSERNLMPNVRTMVYRNNKEVCAKLEWSPGNHLGGATIGNRSLPMSHLVLPGSSTRSFPLFTTCHSAHALLYQQTGHGSSGERIEIIHRRMMYLYAAQNMRIAVFTRITQATAVGPSHGLLQYTFVHDTLLIEALVALCLNRWIDLHGV